MQTDFSSLEKKLNINFKDKNLLTQAFVHRSYLNENGNLKIGHNERLEFLGDAVLELIVTDHLYKEFPQSQVVRSTYPTCAPLAQS
jgi:ribonuclease-3